jgi:hypothetical protein
MQGGASRQLQLSKRTGVIIGMKRKLTRATANERAADGRPVRFEQPFKFGWHRY